jgi:hypothetical protein
VTTVLTNSSLFVGQENVFLFPTMIEVIEMQKNYLLGTGGLQEKSAAR